MGTELMTVEAVKGNEQIPGIQARSRTLAANAANIVVKDDAGAQGATDFIVQVKKAIKTAESVRKSFTTPLREAKSNIDRFFKGLTKPYEEAEATVKDKLKAYHIEQERIRREEEARLAKEQAERDAARAKLEIEAIEKGELLPLPEEPEEETVAPPETMRTVRGMEGGTASIKDHWTFEITEREMIPACYWVVDEKAIQKAINLGLRDIPGLRIYNDLQVAVRT